MSVFVIASVAGRGTCALLSGAPILNVCSLAFFLAGLFLLGIAAYHLRKAPGEAGDSFPR